MKDGRGFERLWKNEAFVSHTISLSWDKGHCISSWEDFCPKYKQAGCLWYLLSWHILFYVMSTILPTPVLTNVMQILQMDCSKAAIIWWSNNQPNVHLMVRKIQHTLSTYKDLTFLIQRDWKPRDPPPPKFLIFFDSISDSMAAAKYLCKQLSKSHWNKIKWFNANMSSHFHEEEVAAFWDGNTWGLCCTGSFGMVCSNWL